MLRLRGFRCEWIDVFSRMFLEKFVLRLYGFPCDQTDLENVERRSSPGKDAQVEDRA